MPNMRPQWWDAVAELALPVECGGCRRPGIRWCRRCAATLNDAPIAGRPRVDPTVPVWAAGRYQGPLRQAVVDVKEHRRRDLVPVLGGLLARTLLRLADWGELPAGRRLALVPAPTRRLAARRRGGDPVTAVAAAAAAELGPRVAVIPLLRTAGWTRDSAGLGAGDRLANLHDAVLVPTRPPPLLNGAADAVTVLLIDDVLTTGATATAAVAALAEAGVTVAATVVLAVV